MTQGRTNPKKVFQEVNFHQRIPQRKIRFICGYHSESDTHCVIMDLNNGTGTRKSEKGRVSSKRIKP